MRCIVDGPGLGNADSERKGAQWRVPADRTGAVDLVRRGVIGPEDGRVHSPENRGDRPFKNLMIELLD